MTTERRKGQFNQVIEHEVTKMYQGAREKDLIPDKMSLAEFEAIVLAANDFNKPDTEYIAESQTNRPGMEGSITFSPAITTEQRVNQRKFPTILIMIPNDEKNPESTGVSIMITYRTVTGEKLLSELKNEEGDQDTNDLTIDPDGEYIQAVATYGGVNNVSLSEGSLNVPNPEFNVALPLIYPARDGSHEQFRRGIMRSVDGKKIDIAEHMHNLYAKKFNIIRVDTLANGEAINSMVGTQIKITPDDNEVDIITAATLKEASLGLS